MEGQKTTEEKQQDIIDEFTKEFGETSLTEKAKEQSIDLDNFFDSDPKIRFDFAGILLKKLREKKNNYEANTFRKEGGDFKMPTHKEMLLALKDNTKDESIELYTDWVNIDLYNQDTGVMPLPVFKSMLKCKRGYFTAYGVVRLETSETLDITTTEGMEKAVKEGETSAIKRVIFRAFPDYDTDDQN